MIVATPVWLTIDDNNKIIYVVTRAGNGKVKRLRNNSKVRIVPCGMRGQPKCEWLDGKATFATSEQLEIALKQRNKKYGLKASQNLYHNGNEGMEWHTDEDGIVMMKNH